MIELSEREIKILNGFSNSEITKSILSRGKTVVNRIKEIKLSDKGVISAHIKGSSSENYRVTIEIDDEADEVDATCTCFYFLEVEEPCKHIAAVTLECLNPTKMKSTTSAKVISLDELRKEGKVKPASSITPKQPVEEKPLLGMELSLEYLPDVWNLFYIVSHSMVQKAKTVYNNSRENILVQSPDGQRFDMRNLKAKTHTFLQKAKKRNGYIVGCNCEHFDGKTPCFHVYGLILTLNERKGRYYFRDFEDYSEDKNKLLKVYGLSVSDELASEFEFGFNYHSELAITKRPKGLLPVFSEANSDWSQITKKLPIKKLRTPLDKTTIVIEENQKDAKGKPILPYDTAILFNLNYGQLGGFKIDSFKITQKGSTFSYTINKLKSKESLDVFKNAPAGLQNALLNIADDTIVRHLRDNTSAYNISDSNPYRNLTSEQLVLIEQEYHNTLKEIAPYLTQWKQLYYLPDGSNFGKANVKPCKFSNAPLNYKIVLKQTDKTVSLVTELQLDKEGESITNYSVHKYVVLHNDTFYFLPEGLEKVKKYLPDGKLIVPIASKHDFINMVVLPLSTKFPIDMGNVIKTETISPIPEPRIYLSEFNEKYLMITPKWLYEDYEMDNDKDEVTTLELGEKLLYINRNAIEENKLVDSLRDLHPLFQNQNNEYFYLHFDEVMKKNWFLNMYQQLQEMDIPIFGMNNLNKFKYNTNKPIMDFKTGSGTDWFDIRMQVSYGDQIVPLATLRKAIINKQQFILLNDGTLGMLPDEWIKKFASVMRMGTIKDDTMQVSKLHWTVIDQLHEQVSEEEILNEILAKKEKLKGIDDVKKLKLPTNIKATLRDYQKSGFQWMSMLDDMGWGGCLADDMGLGKTLQTLTFLSAMQKKHKGETHLIVCPTSLIYNWQTEIDKFTPHLTYYVHYGTERELQEHDVLNADIVITSYGILRSDIELLLQFSFGYIILDESQAIKNHLSQTAKAVQLIKSRNRLILSGTPVQNNTFDLYSQFNFINPGLLGNMEFFKTEFANPIDRDNNKEKSEELRKLIYPFMLRRTKEQVAKDLPEKTETILWCEMEGKQRTIYNSFKDEYRKNIMKKIEEEGFAKAGIYILSGLTKLRQICDSPAILNEEQAYPNVSVKIDELMREIEENSSNHKALVFSQFTTMLDLIGKELTKRKTPFYYLDGSTKAADRQKAVADFQANDEVKIFLISLKAGGVGLNLTAADYVYMVDPWWNPATEQQAIDRTHRIGQKKSVFAYKLICKDSIEEKILQLQQKKKTLSADLISDENGFIKKLTKDDVAYLFS